MDMELTQEIQEFLHKDALVRFLRYVKVWTTSDDTKESVPTSENQLDLGKLLVEELQELKLENIIQDEYGFVYAYLPPSKGFEKVQSIGFLAHMDTSPSVSGKNVKPTIHSNYNGKDIKYTSNKELVLSIDDSPNLAEYIGLDIITSEGDTLLGADNKAGIAEIMAVCSAWMKYSQLKHGPIYICFTPDEETGLGISNVNKKKIPEICYTVDGGEMGELEFECFDAWRADFKFKGLNVHPGYAKNKMINAIQIASRFFSDIPESESPESTEEREGYFHLENLSGKAEEASARMIIRDFVIKNNQRRMDYLKSLIQTYEIRYPGLKIISDFKHQYQNMYKYIEKKVFIVDIAKKSIEAAGLEVKIRPIRGGTDGARLSADGIITPNIFSGGSLFHSRKEFIPTLALQKAAEVLLYLAHSWTQQ